MCQYLVFLVLWETANTPTNSYQDLVATLLTLCSLILKLKVHHYVILSKYSACGYVLGVGVCGLSHTFAMANPFSIEIKLKMKVIYKMVCHFVICWFVPWIKGTRMVLFNERIKLYHTAPNAGLFSPLKPCVLQDNWNKQVLQLLYFSYSSFLVKHLWHDTLSSMCHSIFG